MLSVVLTPPSAKLPLSLSLSLTLSLSADQLIACFGPGGYVLGQSEHELKLVVPQESTELIKTLCTANSIMYHIVFGEPAPAPGFNTIIFALHWRGSGFGYHSDQKSSLITKDFCMVPRQGVMTTVLYEKPAADSGKGEHWRFENVSNYGPAHSNPNSLETLCFIPTEIGTSTRWSESYKNPYRCLLSLPTEHGMVHAQKSGLQEIAKVSARRVLNLPCPPYIPHVALPLPHLFTHHS